jgi:hypothetical protein
MAGIMQQIIEANVVEMAASREAAAQKALAGLVRVLGGADEDDLDLGDRAAVASYLLDAARGLAERGAVPAVALPAWFRHKIRLTVTEWARAEVEKVLAAD